MNTFMLQGSKQECESELSKYMSLYKILNSNIVPIGYQWILTITYEEIENDDNYLTEHK